MTSVLHIREAEVLERQATHLIGTLGHVSEGKSTLIRALTGIKTQRHQKEQERNITIHLGYANCRVYQNTVTGQLRAVQLKEAAPEPVAEWSLIAHLSFVDCPGHEAFLATMLGGASVMDTACLIIAANQEIIPQPQTLEHLIAAEIMGLTRIAVVQNKLDLMDTAAARLNYDKIKGFSHEMCVESAPLFPISAQHGWGVERILNWVTSLPPPVRDLESPMRMTCVRSFDVNKPMAWDPTKPMKGAVIGGTLQRGVVAVGDWLEIRPGILKRGPKGQIVAQPITTRVCEIRCETNVLPYAIPGSLIAISTTMDPGLSIGNGMIGQCIGAPGSLPPIVGKIQVKLKKFKRDTFPFGKQRIGDRMKISFNVMTIEGKITDIEDKRLLTIQLDRPICLEKGDYVGLLRHNAEAERELLEGTGKIVHVEAWKDIEPTIGADEAVAPNRTIVWEPIERPAWSSVAAPPAYAELLDYVMDRKEESMGTAATAAGRLRLEEPTIERIPKHVVWKNWGTTMDMLDAGGVGSLKYIDHFYTYIQKEMVAEVNINANRQAIIAGKWRVEDLRMLLQKYVKLYKRCGQCKGYATGLIKDGKVIKVRCTRCMADNVVD